MSRCSKFDISMEGGFGVLELHFLEHVSHVNAYSNYKRKYQPCTKKESMYENKNYVRKLNPCTQIETMYANRNHVRK